MRYKPKSTVALDIALGGLPENMRVEVNPDIGVRAQTVGELRRMATWLDNLAITTPQGAEITVRVGKATVANSLRTEGVGSSTVAMSRKADKGRKPEKRRD